MKERKCLNCMYSDHWNSSGLGECSRMHYIAFVIANMKCKRHRFNEEDEGMSALELIEMDCIRDL